MASRRRFDSLVAHAVEDFVGIQAADQTLGSQYENAFYARPRPSLAHDQVWLAGGCLHGLVSWSWLDDKAMS